MSNVISANKIKNYLQEINPRLSLENLHESTDLFEIGALDSFSTVQLVLEFEKNFDIVFDYADMNAGNFKTLESIIAVLVSKYGCQIDKT